MDGFLKNIFGTYKGNYGFADGELYIGELNENIHIEVSYCSIGAMHEKAKVATVSETDIEFFLDINDVDYLVNLECGEGELVGSYRIINQEIPLHFTKVSNAYEFSEPYGVIPQQHIELLRKNHSYERKQPAVKIIYELNNQDTLNFLCEIGIETENKHDFSTVKELLRQFSAKIHQDGVNYTHCKEHGTIAQIKRSLSQNSFTNCRGMAIIFSGILRAYGFKSSYVTCLPYSQSDKECHVVCEVYIEELDKFIFIDPSTQVCLMKNDEVLNLLEIREYIRNNEDISYYRGTPNIVEAFDLIGYLGYFSKNIFQFVKCINNCEEKESTEDNSICFVPLEYKDIVKDKYKVISSNINDFYQY